MGIEHLLPQKDFNRASAQRKLEEERKARAEFEAMVKEHKREHRDATMNKSKLSTGSKMSKSAVSSIPQYSSKASKKEANNRKFSITR